MMHNSIHALHFLTHGVHAITMRVMSCTAAVGLASFMLLMSCSTDDITPESVAMQSAKAYYDQLINGDCNSFVEGSIRNQTLRPSYKGQLILNAQMFLQQQQQNHSGIREIEALRAHCDTIVFQGIKDHEGNDSTVRTATAFLAIHYNDNTREEIAVPMIEKDEVWYMQ